MISSLAGTSKINRALFLIFLTRRPSKNSSLSSNTSEPSNARTIRHLVKPKLGWYRSLITIEYLIIDMPSVIDFGFKYLPYPDCRLCSLAVQCTGSKMTKRRIGNIVERYNIEITNGLNQKLFESLDS